MLVHRNIPLHTLLTISRSRLAELAESLTRPHYVGTPAGWLQAGTLYEIQESENSGCDYVVEYVPVCEGAD